MSVNTGPSQLSPLRSDWHGLSLDAAVSDTLWIALLSLLAFSARLWDIGGKGLWYDEASTALMARAGLAEIVQFHWRSAFEHPPLWVLFMHFWSMIWGQSEMALRLPAAFAGALLVPLMWQNLKVCWPADRFVRLVAALLIAVSPVLVLYSQEARMYTVVTLLAAASIYLFLRLQEMDEWSLLAAFVVINGIMLGVHYYSVLLIAAEALSVLITWRSPRPRRVRLIAALALSVLPLILWASLSPGFQTTLRSVMSQPPQGSDSWRVWADRLWRDITFGSVVWQPNRSVAGYILAPLLLLGIYTALRRRDESGPLSRQLRSRVGGILFTLVVLTTVLASALFQGAIHTRYILFLVPAFYVLVALGVGLLWRKARWLGALGLLAPLVIAVLGLTYYYGSYQKSAYRDAARMVMARAAPGDAILLESPRQHLLAKYYFPTDRAIYPIPDVPLPAYWPITSPPVVPEKVDGLLQAILHDHADAWLLLAGQNEVDRGEFVTKYLSAIAYTLDCGEQLDIRWCHYTSPARHPSDLSIPLGLTYNKELQLQGAQLSYFADPLAAQNHVLVTLDWQAEAKPSVDYVVTLRLLDAGGKLRGQADNMPIGPLLPTTAWASGDRKPGYMTMAIPSGLPPGDYRMVLGVYDPRSGAPYQPTGVTAGSDSFVPLASIQVAADDTRLSPAGR